MGRVRRSSRARTRTTRVVGAIGGVVAAATLALVVTRGGCDDAGTPRPRKLDEAVRRERLALIRDTAYEMGVTNAALLAGIAKTETGLAHCAAEAAFGCPGPASPSCGGGPVIAGGADGPCGARAGGLGMFQFDAGTHADTIASYGRSVLTVEGNAAQAVAFVVDKVMLDVAGVDDWRAAVAWLNRVPLVAGEPRTEAWARLIACRYNGCCAASATCAAKARRYRDDAIALAGELGAAFWRTSDRCAAIPDGGIIDERSACYLAAGDPRFWRREGGGHGDDREWTSTTAAAAPGNFALWRLRPARAGIYRIAAHVRGGAATGVAYEIVHDGVTTTVTIDQAGADGFVVLGDFALAAGGDQYVRLADNTGTRDQKLVFDALRVQALDDALAAPDPGGGCATSAPGALTSLVVLAWWRGRGRRRRA